jgi:dolichol-phosphate mannosyltransferase
VSTAKATARAAPADFVVRLDADGTQDPALVPELLACLEQGGADVAVASRYLARASEQGVPLVRRLLSWKANLIFRLLFPSPGLSDYSCGFRAYRAALLARAAATWGADFVALERCGFAVTVEKLLKLRALGARFAEVPLRLDYAAKKSPSRLRLWSTALGCARLVVWGLNPWSRLRRVARQARQAARAGSPLENRPPAG